MGSKVESFNSSFPVPRLPIQNAIVNNKQAETPYSINPVKCGEKQSYDDKDPKDEASPTNENNPMDSNLSDESEDENADVTTLNLPAWGTYIGNKAPWKYFPRGQISPCGNYYISYSGAIYESMEHANELKRGQRNEEWEASKRGGIHFVPD